MPPQDPAQGDPSPGHGVRAPTGAPVTGEHVPAWPARLQASHWPEQALLQQTPSAQNPDEHWLLAAQEAPGPPFAAHWLPAAQ